MLKEILTARTRPSDKALYNIWARKISGGWTETTITGTLPLAFQAKGGDLTDYTVHGTAEGAGAQTSGTEPAGYKIPLTVTSGENAYNKNDPTMHYGAGYAINNEAQDWREYEGVGHTWRVPCLPNTQYKITLRGAVSTFKVATIRTSAIPHISRPVTTIPVYGLYVAATPIAEYDYVTDALAKYIIMQFSASEAEAITEELSVREFNAYPLYIGDTKLGAEEYVDYAEQKIYKDVSGTLTPTDPPVPFPAISAYQGENTMSSTETVGSVSLTGKIKEVTP